MSNRSDGRSEGARVGVRPTLNALTLAYRGTAPQPSFPVASELALSASANLTPSSSIVSVPKENPTTGLKRSSSKLQAGAASPNGGEAGKKRSVESTRSGKRGKFSGPSVLRVEVSVNNQDEIVSIKLPVEKNAPEGESAGSHLPLWIEFKRRLQSLPSQDSTSSSTTATTTPTAPTTASTTDLITSAKDTHIEPSSPAPAVPQSVIPFLLRSPEEILQNLEISIFQFLDVEKARRALERVIHFTGRTSELGERLDWVKFVRRRTVKQANNLNRYSSVEVKCKRCRSILFWSNLEPPMEDAIVFEQRSRRNEVPYELCARGKCAASGKKGLEEVVESGVADDEAKLLLSLSKGSKGNNSVNNDITTRPNFDTSAPSSPSFGSEDYSDRPAPSTATSWSSWSSSSSSTLSSSRPPLPQAPPSPYSFAAATVGSEVANSARTMLDNEIDEIDDRLTEEEKDDEDENEGDDWGGSHNNNNNGSYSNSGQARSNGSENPSKEREGVGGGGQLLEARAVIGKLI